MSMSIIHKEAERPSRAFSSTGDATGRWFTLWEPSDCPAKHQWVILPDQRVTQIAHAERTTENSLPFIGGSSQYMASRQRTILPALRFALIAHAMKTNQCGLQSIALSPLSTPLCSLYSQSSWIAPQAVESATEPARAVRMHANRHSAMHSKSRSLVVAVTFFSKGSLDSSPKGRGDDLCIPVF